ncbi:hypothetical protein ACN38_g11539 [Penicillium nordicum]|uniref:Uncharacterized protein n=1 Tax=Penicillium nordicum TaxID=229535 RepID=A0A0M8P018_9EURO|nr:hypothetical protein ACN38_g11539 [Penicillium nordicum]
MIGQGIHNTQIHSEPIALLRERIRVWRKIRENNLSKNRLSYDVYPCFLITNMIFRLCARWYTLRRSVASTSRLLWLG